MQQIIFSVIRPVPVRAGCCDPRSTPGHVPIWAWMCSCSPGRCVVFVVWFRFAPGFCHVRLDCESPALASFGAGGRNPEVSLALQPSAWQDALPAFADNVDLHREACVHRAWGGAECNAYRQHVRRARGHHSGNNTYKKHAASSDPKAIQG